MSMRFKTASSPHQGTPRSTATVMQKVLLALLPGIFVYSWWFGSSVIIHLLLAVLTCVSAEALFVKMRGRSVGKALSDYSAVVTGILLGLALPTLAPWWIVVWGSLFAMALGKHLYGGLGQNPFNPAMVGYVIMLVSFPKEMTQWAAPANLIDHTLGLKDMLGWQMNSVLPVGTSLDAISSATPLDHMRTSLSQGISADTVRQSSLFGILGGHGWQWVALAWAGGGLWLIQQRIIHWQIPFAMLAALAAISGIFYFIDSATHASPLFHLLSGGAMLGAFFIATDPVTASTTPRGKLIFGAAIGVLVYVIRSWGAYPDGVAFAILIMNMFVPLLDYYTQPRVFGQGRYS